MIKKLAWTFLAIAVPAILFVTTTHPDWLVMPPTLKAAALDCSDKCAEPSDPNRPSYDQWGNEFDHRGNLIKTAPANVDVLDLSTAPLRMEK
jgi:hypothetical protein